MQHFANVFHVSTSSLKEHMCCIILPAAFLSPHAVPFKGSERAFALTQGVFGACRGVCGHGLVPEPYLSANCHYASLMHSIVCQCMVLAQKYSQHSSVLLASSTQPYISQFRGTCVRVDPQLVSLGYLKNMSSTTGLALSQHLLAAYTFTFILPLCTPCLPHLIFSVSIQGFHSGECHPSLFACLGLSYAMWCGDSISCCSVPTCAFHCWPKCC